MRAGLTCRRRRINVVIVATRHFAFSGFSRGRPPMSFLTKDELDALLPAEMLPHTTPIPTQIISSDEYIPAPQSEKQRQVEARLLEMGDDLGKRQGLSRR